MVIRLGAILSCVTCILGGGNCLQKDVTNMTDFTPDNLHRSGSQAGINGSKLFMGS